MQPETQHITLTEVKEDAGSWVTYERAVVAAQAVVDWTVAMDLELKMPVDICAVEEPTYPKSWGLSAVGVRSNPPDD